MENLFEKPVAKSEAEPTPERGRSFLLRTKEAIGEGLQTFFSMPERDKFWNTVAKIDGVLLMGLSAKFAMNPQLEGLLPPGNESDLYSAVAAFGVLGAFLTGNAIMEQLTQKKERDEILKNKETK